MKDKTWRSWSESNPLLCNLRTSRQARVLSQDVERMPIRLAGQISRSDREAVLIAKPSNLLRAVPRAA